MGSFTTTTTALACAAATLRGELQYRANFLVMILMGLVYQGTGLVFIYVVLRHFHTIAGWNFREIAFLYGLRLTMHALCFLIFGALGRLDQVVVRGEFDRFLIRPLPPLLQILSARIELNAFGDLLGGVGLLATACALVHIQWTLGACVYLVLSIIGGCLVEAAVRLILAATAFRLLDNHRLVRLIDELISDFGNYPLTIYNGFLRFVFIFCLPLAFMGYFPATILLSKTRELALPTVVALLSPCIGGLWFVLANALFKRQLSLYQSTGH